jgi:hypothetical protein
MRIRYINAIAWIFGISKKQAAQYYAANKHNAELLSTILAGYENNAKTAFWND